MSKLTQKQKEFARCLALGMNATQAAKAAGYADNSSQALRTQASRNNALPAVQAEAHAQREKLLTGVLASKAIAALEFVLDSPDSPAPAKVAAARFVLEAAGHGLEAKKLLHRIGEGDDRAVSQLSAADLERLVLMAAEQVKFERAAAIEAEILPSDGEAE